MAPNTSFFDDLMGDFDKMFGQEKPKVDLYSLPKTVAGPTAPAQAYPTIHELKMAKIERQRFEIQEVMWAAGWFV